MYSHLLRSVLLLSVPVTMLAADPLVGTWKVNRSKTQYDKRYPVVTYEPFGGSGIRYSTEMGPVYGATLDEKEYPTLGATASTDKVKLKRIDDKSYEITRTRNGRKYSVERVQVRDNGKMLVSRVTTYPEHGEGTTNVYYYSRLSEGDKAMPYFGKWQLDPQKTEYGAEQSVTVAESDGGLKMTFVPGGNTQTVKLDGSATPLPDVPTTTVSGRRIDDRTVELTYKNGPDVTSIVRLSVSSDDKVLNVRVEPHLKSGETRTVVSQYERQ